MFDTPDDIAALNKKWIAAGRPKTLLEYGQKQAGRRASREELCLLIVWALEQETKS